MSRLALIASAILLAPSAMAQEHNHTNHQDHTPAATPQTAPQQDHSGHAQPDAQQPDPHAGHHAGMDHSAMHGATGAHAGHDMTSALGPFPMSRDGSGTAWRPDAAPHAMAMTTNGDWTFMGHGTIDLVFTDQGGPRGEDQGFVAGMLMGSAIRKFDDGGALQFRGAVSPDPLMGRRGYPLLLAAGETADGEDTLVDRQHPHDLFMELSAAYSRSLGNGQSVFVYAGLPGEPAFGPPAFMHRPAAEANPEAPITHHWLDSTHISFGVLTAGYVAGDFKVEASRFRGREPDEQRYDIETGELDSSSIRLSWNPTPNWALQASWADVTSPEQLEPEVDVVKWSASALYSQAVGDGTISFTGAFARKDDSEGVTLDAWLGEATYQPNPDWTFFTRLEAIETNELGLDHHGPVEDVARISLGFSRNFAIGANTTMSIGASATQNGVSQNLSPLYGGDPAGLLGFVRFRIG